METDGLDTHKDQEAALYEEKILEDLYQRVKSSQLKEMILSNGGPTQLC